MCGSVLRCAPRAGKRDYASLAACASRGGVFVSGVDGVGYGMVAVPPGLLSDAGPEEAAERYLKGVQQQIGKAQ